METKIAPDMSIYIMIRVWKKQTKLLKYVPLGRAKIGGGDVDMTHFIKTFLHCLKVLYISHIHAHYFTFYFYKYKTSPKFTTGTLCCIY